MYQLFFAGVYWSVQRTVTYATFTLLERADVYGFKRSFTFIGLFDKLFYLAFCVFRTRNVYVLVVFRWRLSVGSINCSSYSLLCFQNEACLRLCISRFFLPAFIGRFDKLFYPAFCVFRTRNVHVLVVFRRRLSVGSANCSSYSLLRFQN